MPAATATSGAGIFGAKRLSTRKQHERGHAETECQTVRAAEVRDELRQKAEETGGCDA